MKPIYILTVIAFALAASPIRAQVGNGNYFDPEHNPVAMHTDTALQIIVSESVLERSVIARLGQGTQISKMYKSKLQNGTDCLIFEGMYSGTDQRHFSMAVPLVPDSENRYYMVSNQALVCEKPGCSNCSISNGNCIGCCSDSGASSLLQPLVKVPITPN